MSGEQIISQFVDRLHEEYTKTEVEPTFDATDQNQSTSPDQFSTQVVAAWDGKSPLNDAEFVRVSCRELSASGISFWIGHPPTMPFFVVVFETNDETAFIKTRISDAKPDPELDGEPYLVSAEFDGRIDLDFMPSLAANHYK
ncbi:MAG: hypothetical protein HON53_14090 [Planctomycetaceae bacterium]|jgi:hypothetical protein|nr:hypothetical protein [Planctomycetaceae bacterium]MBT6157281.1 hypothetical protein [Planctomycetaceae bacterium]MBT6486803.1 hypothetical protein [Planctomycetaceae bacterium]MBT6493316.1 hypothetical protein [Planctomycetaceae bacterium]